MENNCKKCGQSIKVMRGNVCKGCSKKRNLKIITGLVAVLVIGGGVSWYYATNRNIIGYNNNVLEQEVTIETQGQVEFDLSKVSMRSFDKKIIGGTIDNQESLLALYQKQVELSKEGNLDYIEIPAIQITFDINSALMSEKSQQLVSQYIEIYKNTNQESRILIEGFTCDLGEDIVNDKISKERVDSVVNFFNSQTISLNNIEQIWYGKKRNSEFDFDDITQYRRVVISII